MEADFFRFKHFIVSNRYAAMKVNTDGVLLGAAVELPGADPVEVLDVGTGTGVIALMLAQRLSACQRRFRITGIDIDPCSVREAAGNFSASPWAGSLAAESLSLNGLADRLRAELHLPSAGTGCLCAGQPAWTDRVCPESHFPPAGAGCRYEGQFVGSDCLCAGQPAGADRVCPESHFQSAGTDCRYEGQFVESDCLCAGQPAGADRVCLESHLPPAGADDPRYDLIISNPPYFDETFPSGNALRSAVPEASPDGVPEIRRSGESTGCGERFGEMPGELPAPETFREMPVPTAPESASQPPAVISGPIFPQPADPQSVKPKPAEERRRTAKHTESLSYRELLEFSQAFLRRDGRLAMILPATVEPALLRHGRLCGLFPKKIIRIRTTPQKPPSRLIVEFARRESVPVILKVPVSDISGASISGIPKVPTPETSKVAASAIPVHSVPVTQKASVSDISGTSMSETPKASVSNFSKVAASGVPVPGTSKVAASAVPVHSVPITQKAPVPSAPVTSKFAASGVPEREETLILQDGDRYTPEYTALVHDFYLWA